jgi:hypothetical protein
MKPNIGFSLLLFLSLLASTGYASISGVMVGPNPFAGFPSPGGTGTGGFTNNGFDLTIEKNFTAFGEIPVILFTNRDTDGTDTYSVTERIVNNSGLDWTDFHLNVELIDPRTGVMVDFLNPVLNSPSTGISFQQMPGMLWLFGLIPTGSAISISFDLQVTSQPGATDLFGIHEFPTRDGIVPEMGSLATWAGLALVGIGAGPTLFRRRQADRGK